VVAAVALVFHPSAITIIIAAFIGAIAAGLRGVAARVTRGTGRSGIAVQIVHAGTALADSTAAGLGFLFRPAASRRAGAIIEVMA